MAAGPPLRFIRRASMRLRNRSITAAMKLSSRGGLERSDGAEMEAQVGSTPGRVGVVELPGLGRDLQSKVSFDGKRQSQRFPKDRALARELARQRYVADSVQAVDPSHDVEAAAERNLDFGESAVFDEERPDVVGE